MNDLLENGCFPWLSSNDWTAKEEISLLEGIEQYGLGNWEDIAARVVTRSPYEAREHYEQVYISSNFGQLLLPTSLSVEVIDHTCNENGQLSPSLAPTLSNSDAEQLTLQEQSSLAYLPLRDDFEYEFDNSAEAIVSHLFSNDEHTDELEASFKVAHVDIFRRRLTERLRRHKISKEYSLVTEFFRQNSLEDLLSDSSVIKLPRGKMPAALKRRRSSKTRTRQSGASFDPGLLDVKEKLKIFQQFIPALQHGKFFNSLQRERELKEQIKSLQHFHRSGIKKLANCKAESVPTDNPEVIKDFLVNINFSDVDGEVKTEAKMSPLVNGMNGFGKNGSHLLSENEKTFCQKIGIRPAKYISLKTIILKDCAKDLNGFTDLKQTIAAYLKSNGWISNSSIT